MSHCPRATQTLKRQTLVSAEFSDSAHFFLWCETKGSTRAITTFPWTHSFFQQVSTGTPRNTFRFRRSLLWEVVEISAVETSWCYWWDNGPGLAHLRCSVMQLSEKINHTQSSRAASHARESSRPVAIQWGNYSRVSFQAGERFQRLSSFLCHTFSPHANKTSPTDKPSLVFLCSAPLLASGAQAEQTCGFWHRLTAGRVGVAEGRRSQGQRWTTKMAGCAWNVWKWGRALSIFHLPSERRLVRREGPGYIIQTCDWLKWQAGNIVANLSQPGR